MFTRVFLLFLLETPSSSLSSSLSSSSSSSYEIIIIREFVQELRERKTQTKFTQNKKILARV